MRWSVEDAHADAPLLHRFTCGSCAVNIVPIKAKTTLVVCVDAIAAQWESEIKTHTADGALKVMRCAFVLFAVHRHPTRATCFSSECGAVKRVCATSTQRSWHPHQRYRGIRVDGFIRPTTLAEQDVVIVTYPVFAAEFDHIDAGLSNRSSRRPRRCSSAQDLV